MITKKEKLIKIGLIIIVFIVVDFIASTLVKLDNLLGYLGYLLSYSIIIFYGLYLLKKKDDFALKSYFYIIIILSAFTILSKAINNL